MSKYIVSARKYRPKTFDEVIGQDHIAKTLKNALANDQLAHSFLFHGPRGVGKTTCARILAKVINCENPVDKTEPCNACNSCKSFNENASFNIIELDAASNNSVEHMRTLIEQVRFQPQHGTHKVFIIDEVHMLSTQAFNAFLKTLEEPPSYAIFILATTEKHKILPTILSRCQIFDFKRIQPKDVVAQLQSINKEEERTADLEALHLIGQKADGAMRDALSIYDKVASASDSHIAYKDVITNLNILDYDYYFQTVDAFLRSDLSDVLNLLDKVIRQGFEVDQFIQGLGSHIRDLMVCKDERTLELLEVSDSLKERYLNQSKLVNLGHLLTSLDILNQCDVLLAKANNKRLYTEIALSKISFLSNKERISIIGDEGQDQQLATAEKKKLVERRAVPEPKNTSIDLKAKKESEPTKDIETSDNQLDTVENKNRKKGSSSLLNVDITQLEAEIKQEEDERKKAKKDLSLEGITEFWNEYASNVTSPSVLTALKNCKIQLEEEVIIITVPTLITQNIIQEEKNILTQLRRKYGTEALRFEYTIDKSLFPDFEENNPKEVLTDREKYEKMVEQNADLALFIQKFGLKKNNRT